LPGDTNGSAPHHLMRYLMVWWGTRWVTSDVGLPRLLLKFITKFAGDTMVYCQIRNNSSLPWRTSKIETDTRI